MNGPSPTRWPAFHASCVAFAGRAVLLTGPSGSGKSATALHLMAIGGVLVADDRVDLLRQGGRLIASRPPGLPRLIEARGIGLLPAAGPDQAEVVLVADLGAPPAARLPASATIDLLGLALPRVAIAGLAHGPAALRQYILGQDQTEA